MRKGEAGMEKKTTMCVCECVCKRYRYKNVTVIASETCWCDMCEKRVHIYAYIQCVCVFLNGYGINGPPCPKSR